MIAFIIDSLNEIDIVAIFCWNKLLISGYDICEKRLLCLTC